MDLLGPSELLRAWAGRPGTLLIVPIRLQPGPPTTGMLLYAQGLNQSWDGIHRDLLELVA